MQEILPAYVDARTAKLPSAKLCADLIKGFARGVANILKGIFSAMFVQSPIDRQIEETRYKMRLHCHI